MIVIRRWKCKECSWLGSDSDLLRSVNPFDKTGTIVGCPNCGSINSFGTACDDQDVQMRAQ